MTSSLLVLLLFLLLTISPLHCHCRHHHHCCASVWHLHTCSFLFLALLIWMCSLSFFFISFEHTFERSVVFSLAAVHCIALVCSISKMGKRRSSASSSSFFLSFFFFFGLLWCQCLLLGPFLRQLLSILVVGGGFMWRWPMLLLLSFVCQFFFWPGQWTRRRRRRGKDRTGRPLFTGPNRGAECLAAAATANCFFSTFNF